MKPSPESFIANVSRTPWKRSVSTTSRSRNGTLSKLLVMFPAGECRAVRLLLLPRIYHHIQCKLASLLIQPTVTFSMLIDTAVMYSAEWQTRQRCQMAMSDGNVYVLSVPSFRWIRVTDDNSIRIKHKCVRPQNNTMIVVGGNTPVTNREYDPLPQNCDSATFANGIGIFVLHSLSWMSNYNASYNDAYRIPSKVSDVIGGRYVNFIPQKLSLTKDTGINQPIVKLAERQ